MTGEPRALRNATLVFSAGAVAATGVFAAVTVAPLIATELTKSEAFAGIPAAAATAGTAISALLLSNLMARRGRAAGLRLGFSLALLGSIGSVWAVRAESFIALLVSFFVLGAGFAAYQLGRFAIAEQFEPSRRPRVLGWMVWAATLGALAGPNLPAMFESAAERIGGSPHAAGLLIAAAGMLLATLVTLGLRMPRAGATPPTGDRPETSGGPGVLGLIRGPVLGAMIVAVAAQSTMVTVMAVTPLHALHYDHGLGVVGGIMSAHFVGMFALAPVAGMLVSAVGVRRGMIAGLATIAIASVVAGATPGSAGLGVGAVLFLLGVGWSIAFVAASSVLANIPGPAGVRVQGISESATWISAAAGSVAAGFVLQAASFALLAYVAAGIAAAAITATRLQRSDALA